MTLLLSRTALLQLLVLFGLTYIFSLTAHAQSTYTVTPRVIDITTEARGIETRVITITNNSGANLSIFPTVNEISLDEGGDITEFRGPTMVDRKEAITSWLEITRSIYAIKPGESRDVPLTVRINPNVVPGEYHALLGFGSGKNAVEAQKQVDQNKAPTIVVTIRVPDTKIEFVDLKGFIVDKFVTSAVNDAVIYRLKNPGDTTVIPSGEIIIYDSNNKEKASIDANPDHITLAPGEEIEIITKMPIDGMIGRYKAFLDVTYGANQTASIYDTTFFYVLPWKTLLAIFGAIALLAIILTLYLHRRFGMGTTVDDEGVHDVGFYVREGVSDDQDHDINLKTKA